MTALRFAALFDGRKDAYGLGRGAVVRERVTLHDYERHLQGLDSGIGIFPVRPDNTVRFAAIDLDEPNFDLARTLQLLIPGTSFIERSRSGNAHVWVFFDSPCPAWAARGVLKNATESVGRPEVEIFPKQDRLRDAESLGNYINLPYHGPERPIITPDSETPMESNDFLDRAERRRQDPEAWERRARQFGAVPPEEREASAEFGTSPYLHECAAYILERKHENPLVPGHRAQVLFHVACMLLNWEALSQERAAELVHELNDAGTAPADRREVDRQIANAINGQYTSTGCDDPVMAPYVRPDCPIFRGRA